MCVLDNQGFPVLAAQDVTRIKFLTDGVLLREMMDDPLLTKYRYFLHLTTIFVYCLFLVNMDQNINNICNFFGRVPIEKAKEIILG